jgi:hypothetical protein
MTSLWSHFQISSFHLKTQTDVELYHSHFSCMYCKNCVRNRAILGSSIKPRLGSSFLKPFNTFPKDDAAPWNKCLSLRTRRRDNFVICFSKDNYLHKLHKTMFNPDMPELIFLLFQRKTNQNNAKACI